MRPLPGAPPKKTSPGKRGWRSFGKGSPVGSLNPGVPDPSGHCCRRNSKENSLRSSLHSLPSMGGEGELQNSGNFSLSMARSSLSSLGLSKSGARCLSGMGQGSAGAGMGPSSPWECWGAPPRASRT